MSMPTEQAFIRCEGFFLRALRDEDLDGRWHEWLNDPEVTRYQNKGYFPSTRASQQQYLEALRESRTDVVFALAAADTGVHFGNVGLHAIDWLHRTAVLGIIIGEREYQGRGWGSMAWAAITRYAFETINLNKVCATFIDGNDRSMKCALASGYAAEGRQRSQIYKNGVYLDLHLMGITREDWLLRNGQGRAS